MAKITSHVTEAELFTQLDPATLFEVIADLRTFPEWWLWREPHPRIVEAETTVHEIDGGGTAAVPGTQVEFRTTERTAEFAGAKRIIAEPRVYRIECEVAVPFERVRLLHNAGGVSSMSGTTATDIRISSGSNEARITLRHESTVQGRGVGPSVMRWGHRNGRSTLSRALRRIVTIGQSRAGGDSAC